MPLFLFDAIQQTRKKIECDEMNEQKRIWCEIKNKNEIVQLKRLFLDNKQTEKRRVAKG